MDIIDPVVVDCNQCLVRSAAACKDCFVSVLLGAPQDRQEFEAEELSAIQVLANADLVPPLRLVVARESRSPEGMRSETHSGEIADVV